MVSKGSAIKTTVARAKMLFVYVEYKKAESIDKSIHIFIRLSYECLSYISRSMDLVLSVSFLEFHKTWYSAIFCVRSGAEDFGHHQIRYWAV